MSEWYIEQVFAARTWKLRKEVFSAKGKLSEVMFEEDFEVSHFAAYYGDEVIGVLTLRPTGTDYEILFFAVHADFRKQGAGCALLRYAQEFVKTVAGRRLYVQSERAARAFWIGRGFVLIQETTERDLLLLDLKNDIIAE